MAVPGNGVASGKFFLRENRGWLLWHICTSSSRLLEATAALVEQVTKKPHKAPGIPTNKQTTRENEDICAGLGRVSFAPVLPGLGFCDL